MSNPLCDDYSVSGEPCRRHAMSGSTKCAAHLGTAHRKSMLTPELAENLCVMLRAGNYINVACRANGITRQTLHNWLQRGESEEPEDAVYRELREQVAHARAEGEVRNVTHIARAAAENWQAAAWLLERQYPERWGRVSVRMRDDAAPTADVVADDETDDVFKEIDELAAARRKRLGA